MNKQAPSAGRIFVMVGFALSCFGLLLFLWLAFGGPIPLQPKGYQVRIAFPEAGQLAQEADVRISGVPVGKVKKIEPKQGISIATIQLDTAYAPLPSDSRAVLRQKSLLGETYVELTPGSPNAPKLKEDGLLRPGQVSKTVELDEVVRAFDPKTRAAFQQWMQGQAVAIKGRGRDINSALANLAPFAEDTNHLLVILNSQQGAVQRLVRNTGEVFSALSERDGQLRSLIQNSNTVFATTAARNQELADTFRILPTFERESTTTIRRLTKFSQDTNPLVTQLRPAARELSPTLQQLDLLAPDLESFFRHLNPLIDASKAGLPALQQFLDQARPLIGELDPFLRQVNPILRFIGRYNRELTTFFANTVGATQASDIPPGSTTRTHYLRTTNPLNPENLAVYPRRIGSNRTNPYTQPGKFDRLSDPKTGYLRVFDDRSCGNGVPSLFDPNSGTVPPILQSLIPQQLYNQIFQFAFKGGSGVPAPPCVLQPKFTVGGETTQYPHVREDAAAK